MLLINADKSLLRATIVCLSSGWSGLGLFFGFCPGSVFFLFLNWKRGFLLTKIINKTNARRAIPIEILEEDVLSFSAALSAGFSLFLGVSVVTGIQAVESLFFSAPL